MQQITMEKKFHLDLFCKENLKMELLAFLSFFEVQLQNLNGIKTPELDK